MLPLQPALVQPAPPVTLADVLPDIRWSLAERGPLLVVGAEKLELTDKNVAVRGTALRELLPHFKCKLLRAGNMWAVGPESMWALSDWRSMTPEKLAAQEAGALMTLFSALSSDHWKKAGSTTGLGREDLPIKLQPLFDVLLPGPNPLVNTDEEGVRHPVPLTPLQRAGAKLHLAWSYDWRLSPIMYPDRDFEVVSAGDSLPSTDIEIDQSVHFSQLSQLLRQVPNRPKPSALDFSQLEGSISLKDISTVKSLIARIAQATKLELYADTRIEKLSVYLRGDRARIGDVLQALCLAVGGTVRQVGDAYLLTEERVPWFMQSITQREIETRADALQAHAYERLVQKLKKERTSLRAAIQVLPGEPHPDELSIYEGKEYKAPNIPPSVQSRVNVLVRENEYPGSLGGDLPDKLRSDWVHLSPDAYLWMSLPDHGNIVNIAGFIDPIPAAVRDALLSKPDPTPEPVSAELKKPVRWPARWKTRIARIAPVIAEEALVQAQAAREAGFTELWLDIPIPQQQAGALVKAAAKSGLPVTLVVSPLARPPGSEGDGFLSDLLASGETTDADWRRDNLNLPAGLEPEPGPKPRFLVPVEPTISPVCELARLPGVKGLALMELTRPGYTRRENELVMECGGYILAWRLAFLRRWHIDPADLPYLPKANINTQTWDEGSFFTLVESSLWMEWKNFCIEQAQRWRQLLYTRLRLANPQAQLFIRTSHGNAQDDNKVGFIPWSNGSVLPKVNPQNLYFTEFQAESSTTPEQMRWQLNALIPDDKGTRFLCDLTKVSSLPYLKELQQPTPATRTPGNTRADR